MAQPCLIHFKAWKDWYIFISVGHGFELRLLEEGCKVNCSLHVDFDKHQLVDEFIFEVGKMSEHRVDFRKVSNSNWTFGAQVVGFNEHFGLVEPHKEIILDAVELDTSKGLIT